MSSLQYASVLSQSDVSSQPNKISIFDLIAQENMQSLFRPAFNYVLKWLTNIFPNFGYIAKYADQLYLALHSFIEFAYIKSYNALFSEHFYGMQRHGLSQANNLKHIFSVVFAVVIPYLKAKMDNYYEELERLTENVTGDKSLLKKLFVLFYPYINLIWHSVFWLYRFRFMTNQSSLFNSPILQFLNTPLMYSYKLPVQSDGILSSLVTKSSQVFTSLIYMLQFYQWYENYNRAQSFIPSIEQTSLSQISLSTIKPPELPRKLANSSTYQAIASADLCPLCMGKKNNPCVLEVSGFVFCYTCILKFIRQYQRCPLTHLPCDTKNIVRIYDSSI